MPRAVEMANIRPPQILIAWSEPQSEVDRRPPLLQVSPLHERFATHSRLAVRGLCLSGNRPEPLLDARKPPREVGARGRREFPSRLRRLIARRWRGRLRHRSRRVLARVPQLALDRRALCIRERERFAEPEHLAPQIIVLAAQFQRRVRIAHGADGGRARPTPSRFGRAASRSGAVVGVRRRRWSGRRPRRRRSAFVAGRLTRRRRRRPARPSVRVQEDGSCHAQPDRGIRRNAEVVKPFQEAC